MICQISTDSSYKPHIAVDNSTYFLPISLISLKNYSKDAPPASIESIFYYKVLIMTIDSLLKGNYSNFDAHTTSTCCHGIALYAYELIFSALSLNLLSIRDSAFKKINEIESLKETEHLQIPFTLLELCRLYICQYVKEIETSGNKRTITRTRNLQKIASVSVNYCNNLVHDLQKYFSNLVTKNYSKIKNETCDSIKTNQISIAIWSKYISQDYLRIDKRGIIYASCLYSMQTTLGFLIYSNSKIAVINDFKTLDGSVERFISILEGDGQSNFRELSPDELLEEQENNPFQPLIVFAGCAHIESCNLRPIIQNFKDKIKNFPNLVLACDIYYPQFPKIANDQDFDSTPIQPEEKEIKDLLKETSKMGGVSIQDPSLFCLTHIHPSSLKQVLSNFNSDESLSLPISFLPTI